MKTFVFIWSAHFVFPLQAKSLVLDEMEQIARAFDNFDDMGGWEWDGG